MWQAADISLPADHPSAAGHFPANPIVPGALILDQVVAAIAAGSGTGATGMTQVKFLRPVRHGEPLALRWQVSDTGAARFECVLAGGEIAVTGVIALGPLPR